MVEGASICYAGVFLTIRLGLWVLERAWHMAEGCPTVFSTPGDSSHCPHNILWLPGVKEGGEAPAPWSGHCIHILSESLCKEQRPLLTHLYTYSIMIFISMDFIYIYIKLCIYSYFVLWVIIQYYIIYSVVQILLDLAIETLSGWII